MRQIIMIKIQQIAFKIHKTILILGFNLIMIPKMTIVPIMIIIRVMISILMMIIKWIMKQKTT